MSSISDIVGRVIELCETPAAGIDVHRAIEVGMPLVRNDPDMMDQLAREGLAKRIKDQATRIARQMEGESPDDGDQLDFFGKLRPRYALDTDGRRLKNTRDLTRIEFRRLITIREEQVAADMAHLKILRDAEDAVSLLWDFHPDLAFGQVMDLYLSQRSAAD